MPVCYYCCQDTRIKLWEIWGTEKSHDSPSQARSQGGFEGVRTAAAQGTIIQPCSGIVTDGIQAIMQLLQGVVTYMSPV